MPQNPPNKPPSASASALLELMTWLLLPAFFLYIYIFNHHAPFHAATIHLALVSSLWLAIGCLRMITHRVFSKSLLPHMIAVLLLSLGTLFMFTYYTAVLLGLHYWNRVISVDVLQSYLPHFPVLLKSLDLNLSALFLTAIAIAVLQFCIWNALLKRANWVKYSSSKLSTSGSLTIAIASLATIAVSYAQFAMNPPGDSQEPLALTLFSQQFSSPLQHLDLDRSRSIRLDRMEDEARQLFTPLSKGEDPNLILIVVDALRADRLAVLGADRETTPFLSELSRNGKFSLKANLHAVCAESSCGLFAMATSRFPHNFSPRAITIIEALRSHGYRVQMILSGDHTRFYGLRYLYGDVDSFLDGSKTPDYYINDDRLVLDSIASMPRWDGQPTMIQLHLMSAHNLGKRWDKAPPFQPSLNYAIPSNRSSPHALNFYDNGVAQVDFVIEQALVSLAAHGYLDNAIVAITADHGESLGEHGIWAHSFSVREAELRIPFLLIKNWSEPGLSRAQTHNLHQESILVGSQIDIAPTLLSSMGLRIPESWEGSVLPTDNAERIWHFRQKRQIGIVKKTSHKLLKYWLDIHSGAEFLFDLGVDPQEHTNLILYMSDRELAPYRKIVLEKAGAVSSRPDSFLATKPRETAGAIE